MFDLFVLSSSGITDLTGDELPIEEEGAEEISAEASGPEEDVVMNPLESAPTEESEHVSDEASAHVESKNWY